MAMAINKDVILSNHRKKQIQNHINDVKITCHTHVISDIFQTSFIIFGVKFSHTIKRSMATHTCDSVFISHDGEMIQVKLTIRPTIIYHIINGCFSSLIIYEIITANTITKLKSINTFSPMIID